MTSSMVVNDTLISVLGQGSFGRVEKIKYNHCYYARKVSPLNVPSIPTGLCYATVRECDIYSRFHSCFMVSVWKMEIKNHQVHIWMGLADKSLLQYTHEATKREDRIQVCGQVLWSVLNFLKYIHTYQILHRDLKPDNILIRLSPDNKCQVYVADMGAGRLLPNGHTVLTEGMGTRGYRPPEMVQSNKYSKSSDVYCLGATIVNVMTRKRPCPLGHPLKNNNKKQKKLVIVAEEEKENKQERKQEQQQQQQRQQKEKEEEKEEEEEEEQETLPEEWQNLWKTMEPYVSSELYDLVKRMIEKQPAARISVHQALEHAFFKQSTPSPIPKMNYWPFPGNYCSKINLSEIDRSQWIEYMVQQVQRYQYTQTTAVYCVYLFDDFFARVKEPIHETKVFELYCLSLIWLTSKYFERILLDVQTLIQQSGQKFTVLDFVTAEENIFQSLQFRIVSRPIIPCIQKKIESKEMSWKQLSMIVSHTCFMNGQVSL